MIYLDVSNAANFLARNPQGTGVQRVTLSLARNIKDRCGDGAAGIVARHNKGGVFIAEDLSDEGLRRDAPFALDEYLGRYREKPLKKLFHGVRLAYNSKARARRNIVGDAGLGRHTPQFTAVDTVLNFEAIAHTLPGPYVCALKTSGAFTAGIVHDLIPVALPHLCRGEPGKVEWLRHISAFAQLSPLWICNSEYTRKDLLEVLNQLELQHRGSGSPAPISRKAPDTCVVPLAHEFPETRPEFAYTPQNFILYVGHRGQRKGMRCLADAFLQVCEKHPGVHLVLAGSPGSDGVTWDVRNVHRIDHPTDGQLTYLYRKCMFTVYPSEYEGWGLPIGESLWFGKNVICAHNTSLPEVGGEWATYFEAGNSEELAGKMLAMIDEPRQLPADLRSHLRTWNDVADDLYAALTTRSQLRLAA